MAFDAYEIETIYFDGRDFSYIMYEIKNGEAVRDEIWNQGQVLVSNEYLELDDIFNLERWGIWIDDKFFRNYTLTYGK